MTFNCGSRQLQTSELTIIFRYMRVPSAYAAPSRYEQDNQRYIPAISLSV